MERKSGKFDYVDIPNRLISKRKLTTGDKFIKANVSEIRIYWLLQRYCLERYFGIIVSVDLLVSKMKEVSSIYDSSYIRSCLNSLENSGYISINSMDYLTNTTLTISLKPIGDYTSINEKWFDIIKLDTHFYIVCLILKYREEGHACTVDILLRHLDISRANFSEILTEMKKARYIFEYMNRIYLNTEILGETKSSLPLK